MSGRNQEIGAWGEEVAVDHLAGRGLSIIGRNIRTPYGEIDIIARRGDLTIFIEVKTLTSSRTMLPEDNITSRKRDHMIACAEHYAAENSIDHWQIDVLSIEGKPGDQAVITYFENAL